jgi:hypothetical protein
MSRNISVTNLAQINAAHLHLVTMVKLSFDTPLYVHSGVGTISYDGNDYLGVGDLGSVSEARESESLSPSSITLSLSGIDSNLISEAQEAGRYRDAVTIYEGYRQDDGTLVDDPWIVWKGWFEYASIRVGEDSAVAMTCHHDLSVLTEKDGSRFSDEDQLGRYSGDRFFQFVTDQSGLRLVWGGTLLGTRTEPGGVPPGGRIR